MNTSPIPLPPHRRRRRLFVAAVAVVGAVILAFAVQQSLSVAFADTAPGASSSPPVAPTAEEFPRQSAVLDADDGVILDGEQPTVFDEGSVAVVNLQQRLLAALQRAAVDASHDGVEFRVNSGWRSAALQKKTLEDAIVEYGSEEEARRWVATPETSEHVSGDAVDLGSWDALDWLVMNGWRYGLCQIYANEPWHYELRLEAVDERGCPEMYADPTENTRMQP